MSHVFFESSRNDEKVIKLVIKITEVSLYSINSHKTDITRPVSPVFVAGFPSPGGWPDGPGRGAW